MQHDHSLLKERVARLGGPKATARLEAGLAAARAAALAQPSTSPNSSPDKSSPSARAVPNSPKAVSGSPVAGGPGDGGDENEGMAWELLYNLQWQLPTAELEAGWKDATGETSVMRVSTLAHTYINTYCMCPDHVHQWPPLAMTDCHHSPACCLKWVAEHRCALIRKICLIPGKLGKLGNCVKR